jgi:hypothetical protein
MSIHNTFTDSRGLNSTNSMLFGTVGTIKITVDENYCTWDLILASIESSLFTLTYLQTDST